MNKELIARCYIKKAGNLWVAVCIDFCLATQGESREEAKLKLEEQIVFYVEEALNDEVYGYQLLNRRSPISNFLVYYLIKAINAVKLTHIFCKNTATVFSETMPIRLA